MNGTQVFGYIFNQIESPLLQSIADLMTALVAYAAEPVQTSLVLYIALTGILMLRGHASEAVGSLFSRFIKMTIVVWFATNGALLHHVGQRLLSHNASKRYQPSRLGFYGRRHRNQCQLFRHGSAQRV